MDLVVEVTVSGDELRAIRETLGLSASQLGRALGYSGRRPTFPSKSGDLSGATAHTAPDREACANVSARGDSRGMGRLTAYRECRHSRSADCARWSRGVMVRSPVRAAHPFEDC